MFPSRIQQTDGARHPQRATGDLLSNYSSSPRDQKVISNRRRGYSNQSSNQSKDQTVTYPPIQNLTLNDETFPSLAVAATVPVKRSSITVNTEHDVEPPSFPPSSIKLDPSDEFRNYRANRSCSVDLSTLLLPVKRTSIDRRSVGQSLRKPPTLHSKSGSTALQDPRLKGNALDSTIPTVLRGKEKANPGRKKPSALRQAIIKSRERAADEAHCEEATDTPTPCHSCPVPGTSSETEPEPVPPPKQAKPDRTFYCTDEIPQDVSVLAGEILDKMTFYQDRAHKQDPLLYKKRFVCGFRDVLKHIETKEIKLIFLASDMERVDGVGGITDHLANVREKADTFNLPIIFVMKRRVMGRKCKKNVPVSIVGLYNYDVAAGEVKKLLALVDSKQTGGATSAT